MERTLKGYRRERELSFFFRLGDVGPLEKEMEGPRPITQEDPVTYLTVPMHDFPGSDWEIQPKTD